MNNKRVKKATVLLTTGVLLGSYLAPSFAFAQETTGNVEGNILDSENQTLPLSSPDDGNMLPSAVYMKDKQTSDEKKVISQDASDSESSNILQKNNEPTVQGSCGTAPISLDLTTGTLTIGSGVVTYLGSGQGATLAGWMRRSNMDSSMVSNINIDGSLTFTDGDASSYFFASMDNLKIITGLGNLTFGTKYNLRSMFLGCSSLLSLDIANLNTSGATDVGNMFQDCSSLTTLDLSNFDTSKVTYMGQMFSRASSLSSVNISNFDTSNVTGMDLMFDECTNLKAIDVSHFNTSNVTNMYGMFYDCSSLAKLNLSNFDTRNVTEMTDMLNLNVGAGYSADNFELSLGKYFVSTPGNSIMDDIGDTDKHTNKWQNVGEGTVNNPKGNFIYTSYDLMANYDGNTMSDMYVFQRLEPVKGADVTAKYIDTKGSKISEDIVKSGNVGDDYSTEQKEIAGYTFKEVQGNVSGQFTNQAQTVNYIYTKNPISGGDVIAKYVDTDGNSISEDIVKSGNVGDDYSTEQKEIAGYTLKEVQGNVSGQFTNQAQTVTYIYTKNPISGGDVTAKYVDTDGNSISKDIVKSGNIGEDYSTEQKEIASYTFKEVQGNISGQFTNQAQTVIYVYTKSKVIPESKTDNKTKYKEETHHEGIALSAKDALPETGESEKMALINVYIGFIFLVISLITTLLGVKKFRN
ncbi:MucBP domain-containing protein [Lactococcus sp. S64]|uniref:MucBP domain-containing protein n=1 Tax=Lactococcus sp. S64 TaxID=2767459 RepID=UPI001F3B6A04|nr:MucBP domain-containing protein [Lactococcus sp. S64]